MRQPQNGRPGVIGDNHGLTRLTQALEALEAGQRKQETRDAAIQAQLATQAVLLTQAVRWGRYQLWAIVGLGVLVLTLVGLVGWQVWHPPEQGYARALGALDATLAQPWGSLPKPVQASLTRTYGRRGWTSPGDRSGSAPVASAADASAPCRGSAARTAASRGVERRHESLVPPACVARVAAPPRTRYAPGHAHP